MERNHNTFLERLLLHWGGSYIPRVLFVTLLISYIFSAPGIYYIFATSALNSNQATLFWVSITAMAFLAAILVLIFITLTSSNLQKHLNWVLKGKKTGSIPNDGSEELSWKELNALTSRIIYMEVITILVVVVAPIALLMFRVGEVKPNQLLHITIGGIIAGIIVTIHNSLFLERSLLPIRKVLQPSRLKSAGQPGSLKFQTRFFGIFFMLILATIIMLGGIGFQRSINASLPGANIPLEISEFQKQSIILGIMVLLLGLVLGRMATRSFSFPIQELVKTMALVQKGDFSARATILTSDETTQLVVQLNKVLEQLQSSSVNLEKLVDEQTTDINKKGTQFQVAARIFQEASTASDLNIFLSKTVSLITENFYLYHVGIYLLDEYAENSILVAASSDGGRKMISRGYKVEVGSRDPVGLATYDKQLHIVSDTNKDFSFQHNPDLPRTRSQMVLPLATHGKLLGVLDLQSVEPNVFKLEEIGMFQIMADQVALALQNILVIEENRNIQIKMDAILSENVNRAWQVTNIVRNRGYRYTPTGLVALQQLPDNVAVEATGMAGFDVPIVLRGENIGKIKVRRKGENSWGDAEQSLASEIASQIGLAIENSRLLQDAQQRASYEQSLSDLTTRLGRSVDPDILLQTAVQELHKIPNVTEVSIFLSPPEDQNADA